MSLLFINEDELRQTINLSEAQVTLETAIKASTGRRVHGPGSFVMSLPEVNGKVQVKGTYLQESPYYVVNIGSNFIDNPRINLPVSSGMTGIFDAATGFPAAILLDNGYLTRVRAGVAGALAARYLANPSARQAAVIGTGRQAYFQLKAMLATTNIELVKVWDRTPLKADAYAQKIFEDHEINLMIAPSIESAVVDADIIITTTPSEQPLIEASWLKPGAHITAVGSDTPLKQELSLDVLQRADVIVVDNLKQSELVGEVHHGLKAGRITPKDIQGELDDLILGNTSGRTDPGQITLADLTGLDWQDAVIAVMALEKAMFLGLGQRLDLGLKQRQLVFEADTLL